MCPLRVLREKKYLDACFEGNIKVVEYMLKSENKLRITEYFLVKCLNRACDGDDNDNYNASNNGAIHIDVCKAILQSITIVQSDSFVMNNIMLHACTTGKIKIAKFYMDEIQYDRYNYNLWMYYACEAGNVLLIKYIISVIKLHENNFMSNEIWTERYLQNTCKSGNLESVEIFISCDFGKYWSWDKYLISACKGGNIEIVKLVVGKGALNFDECILVTSNLDIVKLLLELLKNGSGGDGNSGGSGGGGDERYLSNACKKGYFEVAKYMAEKIGIADIEEYTNDACREGHIEIFKFMVENGASDWYNYAGSACVRNKLEIIKYIVKWGRHKGVNISDHFNNFLYCACLRGDFDFAIEVLSIGGTDINRGLLGACKIHPKSYENCTKLVKLMVDCGATNLNESLEMTYISGDYDYDEEVDIINILVSSGATKLDRLSNTCDFKLHCIWLRYKGIKPNRENDKWLKLIEDFPPCVLLVGSRFTKNNECRVNRLPFELFTILGQYF